MCNEQWREFQVYDCIYRVSNQGFVYSQYKSRPLILFERHNRIYFRTYRGGKMVRMSLADVVARCFVDNPHGFTKIVHKDGDYRNCVATNLEWHDDIEDLDGEIWKDIEGFDGCYQVSNMGRVKSNKSDYTNPKGRWHLLKQHRKSQYGHLGVCLFNKDGTRCYVGVHRLVANSFVPKKEGCNVVNHLDENPSNNKSDNLEWTTPYGNMLYSDIPEKGRKARRRFCQVFDLNNRLIGEYESIRAAATYMGIDDHIIIACCKGERDSYKGYKFKILK